MSVPRFAGKWSSAGSASCTNCAAGSNTDLPPCLNAALATAHVLLFVEAHYMYYHAVMLGLSAPAAAVQPAPFSAHGSIVSDAGAVTEEHRQAMVKAEADHEADVVHKRCAENKTAMLELQETNAIADREMDELKHDADDAKKWRSEKEIRLPSGQRRPVPPKRGLSEDERALIELFKDFDHDGDGTVSHPELREYLQSTPWAASWVQREGFSWSEVVSYTFHSPFPPHFCIVPLADTAPLSL